jgi:hypothetical protein
VPGVERVELSQVADPAALPSIDEHELPTWPAAEQVGTGAPVISPLTDPSAAVRDQAVPRSNDAVVADGPAAVVIAAPTAALPLPSDALIVTGTPAARTEEVAVAPARAVPTSMPVAAANNPMAGTEVKISEAEPERRSDVTVSLKLVRDGRPIANADVYLVAHYRTIDERHPAGEGLVRTGADGVASLTFNIGDATRGYTVVVDLAALVEGQIMSFQTSFTPR